MAAANRAGPGSSARPGTSVVCRLRAGGRAAAPSLVWSEAGRCSVSTPSQVRFPGAGALRETGRLFALGLDVCRAMQRRPFQIREIIQQSWFIAIVTTLPTALVAIT